MREARSYRLTLRSAKYSSAAEINILMVESRIRRISLALASCEKEVKNGANRRPYAEVRRLGMVLSQSGNSRATRYCDPLTPRVKRPGTERQGSNPRCRDMMSDQTILVTGAAGFIGFHVARRLLAEGRVVVGLDNLNSYYDPGAEAGPPGHPAGRMALFASNGSIWPIALRWRGCSPGTGSREWCISLRRPGCAIRSTIRTPMPTPISRASSTCWKVAGIMAAAHLVYASSSSVYGANTKLPFSVDDKTDHPISLYAATKKANELIAHSYSHLYRLAGDRFAVLYHLRAVGPARYGDLHVHEGDPRGHPDQAL